MEGFVARHGFLGSYVYRAGRGEFSRFRCPAGPGGTRIDALRRRAAIGGAGPDRWLTILFTADL
jgi:hypothetical protein